MEDNEIKRKIRESFDAVAEGYDDPSLRFFPASAKLMPACLGLVGGEHVLDVATGTGHVAMELARALPEGRVTGVDFSEKMLARAAGKMKAGGIGNVRFARMDMQALDFPDGSFDAASMAFCLFFVEDMEGLLCNVVKKVRPGGRIAFTSFMEGTFSPQIDMFMEKVKKYGVEVPLGWRKLASKESCESLLRSAGVINPRVEVKDLGYHMDGPGQWWSFIWNAGLRRYVSSFAPEETGRFREEFLSEIAALPDGAATKLNVNVLFASGVKPS
ncbi:MAG: methyltransferase domain-containing protein [Nitrospinae bacterium]|nr:methyltransferase domain-containing protein [Nitrospinota bacterium]